MDDDEQLKADARAYRVEQIKQDIRAAGYVELPDGTFARPTPGRPTR